jgi:hypothetical protein
MTEQRLLLWPQGLAGFPLPLLPPEPPGFSASFCAAVVDVEAHQAANLAAFLAHAQATARWLALPDCHGNWRLARVVSPAHLEPQPWGVRCRFDLELM